MPGPHLMDNSMSHHTTFLSFWNVELSNLPVGAFTKRALRADEARALISSARLTQSLISVAEDDLGAPYGARARERHEQLCVALRDHADIAIQLLDFFGRDCANPLCLAEVSKDHDLLVVDCAYVFDDEARVPPAPDLDPGPAAPCVDRPRHRALNGLRMRIAPDTIKFYLFEYTE